MFSKSDVRNWSHRQITTSHRLYPLPVRLLIIFVALVMIGALLLSRVSAQNSVTFPAYACTAADYADMSAIITKQLDSLSAPDAQPGVAMVVIRAALDTYQAKCTGGTFTNVTNPDGIIGPVVFDGSLYKVTMRMTPGEYAFGSMTWTPLSGDCGLIPILSISDSTGTGSQTDILKMDSCTAIFEVNVSGGDWNVTFEKIG